MSQPYRALQAAAPRALTFYPSLSFSGGLSRLIVGVFSAVVMVTALLALRPSAGWMMVPLVIGLMYATAGERHQIVVSEREVRLGRSLWPFVRNEWRFEREDVREIATESYDDEVRLVLRTHSGRSHPLTEAFSTDKKHTEAVRQQIHGMLFPEELKKTLHIPPGSVEKGTSTRGCSSVGRAHAWHA